MLIKADDSIAHLTAFCSRQSVDFPKIRNNSSGILGGRRIQAELIGG
jgi:hypothetical protein